MPRLYSENLFQIRTVGYVILGMLSKHSFMDFACANLKSYILAITYEDSSLSCRKAYYLFCPYLHQHIVYHYRLYSFESVSSYRYLHNRSQNKTSMPMESTRTSSHRLIIILITIYIFICVVRPFQHDFIHFEPSQSLGGAKTGDSRKKKLHLTIRKQNLTCLTCDPRARLEHTAVR